MTTAPIVLFAYARPEHARRTLEALAANALADQSDLIVYADAARSEREVEAVRAVRELIRVTSGFRSVTLIERDMNFGLARNIIEGVSEVLRQHERIIVLEDDMMTSPFFLTYMNEALERYRGNEQVMHISGFMYPIPEQGLPQSFFLPPATCWGWGTWRRAWAHFRKAPDDLIPGFSPAQRRAFNLDQSFPYWTQVELNACGKMDTWAVFWYASIFQHHGLCLHPRRSYVQNIGNDDSGTHGSCAHTYTTVVNQEPISDWRTDPGMQKLALQRLQDYFRRTTSWRARLRMALDALTIRLPGQADRGVRR